MYESSKVPILMKNRNTQYHIFAYLSLFSPCFFVKSTFCCGRCFFGPVRKMTKIFMKNRLHGTFRLYVLHFCNNEALSHEIWPWKCFQEKQNTHRMIRPIVKKLLLDLFSKNLFKVRAIARENFP